FEAWRRTHGERSQWARTLGATSPAPQNPSRPVLLPWLLCGLLVALLAGVGAYAWLIHARTDRQPAPSTQAASRGSRPAEKAGHETLPAKGQGNVNESRVTTDGPPPPVALVKPEVPALAGQNDAALAIGHDQ